MIVATLVSATDHSTVKSPSSGSIVAFSCFVSPISNETDVSSSVSDCGFIGSTVTLHSAFLSPTDAVMVAEPSPTAFTVPLVTVATVSSDVAHMTVGSVASAGDIVTVKIVSSPVVKVTADADNEMLSTAITFLVT